MGKRPVIQVALWILLATEHAHLFFANGEPVDQSNDNGGALWLRNALGNYKSWVEAKNLDPSPIVTSPKNASGSNPLVKLDCEVWNYFVEGFSSNIEVGITYFNLSSGELYLQFWSMGDSADETKNVTIIGEYTANGTVSSSIPFSGSGNFQLVFEYINHRIYFNGVQVTSDGFLQLSLNPDDNKYYIDLASEYLLTNYHFEGMLEDGAGGFADQVAEKISRGINEVFNKDNSLPVSNVLFTYFEQLFEKTPLVDIIGFKPIPTTTAAAA